MLIMDIKKIKEEYSHLPHIKKVWVKAGHVFLSKVKGSEEIDLSKANIESEKETILQESPVVKVAASKSKK